MGTQVLPGIIIMSQTDRRTRLMLHAACNLAGLLPTLRILFGEPLLHSFSYFGVQKAASQAFNVIQRQAVQGPLVIPL